MAKEKISPLFDYILIEPLEEETTTPSGIVIPDSAKEKPQKGKIIAAGPGRVNDDGETIKLSVKVGDIVMFKKWGGSEIKIEGKELKLVREEDLLAIVS
jgi:chaperonin GroES